MKHKNAIIIYEAEKVEAYRDLRTFCKVKGLSYYTYVAKPMPFYYDGYYVKRETGVAVKNCIEYNGELIPVI